MLLVCICGNVTNLFVAQAVSQGHPRVTGWQVLIHDDAQLVVLLAAVLVLGAE